MLICGGPEEGEQRGGGQWCIEGGSVCVFWGGLLWILLWTFFFLWSLVVYLCIAWMLCGAPLSSPNRRQLAGRETQMRTGSDGMYVSNRRRAMWVGCRHVCVQLFCFRISGDLICGPGPG